MSVRVKFALKFVEKLGEFEFVLWLKAEVCFENFSKGRNQIKSD